MGSSVWVLPFVRNDIFRRWGELGSMDDQVVATDMLGEFQSFDGNVWHG